MNGRDEDLAEDQTRIINRLRDALLNTSPTLEQAVGRWLTSPGILDLLRAYPTIGQLRKAGRARIRTLIHKRSPRLSNKAPPYLGSGEIPNHRTTRPPDLDRNHIRPSRRPRPNRKPPQTSGKNASARNYERTLLDKSW